MEKTKEVKEILREITNRINSKRIFLSAYSDIITIESRAEINELKSLRNWITTNKAKKK